MAIKLAPPTHQAIMSARLKYPIALGVIMILLLVAITVGWVLLNVDKALSDHRFSGLYWTLLAVGSVCLAALVCGVVIYLSLSIKAINLNRRQSNFIDSVTHELKSPIASLKLYLQTLGRRQVADAERADFHRFMLEDVERLDQLINHMLDAGRVERDALHGDVEDVSLEALLQDCAETVCARYQISRDAVQLELEPLSMRGRLVDLDMIFRNLIDNAIKYSGQEPEVLVTCRLVGDGRTITRISDNGRGIPPKLRRKIFGRFVRLGQELERDTPGTGLGLYIVRTLVRRLGGSIRVRDRREGHGTEFEVQLPGGRRLETTPEETVDAQQAGVS